MDGRPVELTSWTFTTHGYSVLIPLVFTNEAPRAPAMALLQRSSWLRRAK